MGGERHFAGGALKITLLGQAALPDILRADEETLLRGEPAVLVALGAAPYLSLGVSQRMEDPLVARAREAGLEVVQRTSGGSALLHRAGDVFWSVTLPRDHPTIRRGFVQAYAPLGAGWRTFLDSKGISAGWRKTAPSFPAYCFLSGRGEVLEVRGKVIGGASQHVSRKALLHHGVVSASLDRTELETLFSMPPGLTRNLLTSLSEEGCAMRPQDLEPLASCLEKSLS